MGGLDVLLLIELGLRPSIRVCSQSRPRLMVFEVGSSVFARFLGIGACLSFICMQLVLVRNFVSEFWFTRDLHVGWGFALSRSFVVAVGDFFWVLQLLHFGQQGSSIYQIELTLLLALSTVGGPMRGPFHNTKIACLWDVWHSMRSLSGVKEASWGLVLRHLQHVLNIVVLVLSANCQ